MENNEKETEIFENPGLYEVSYLVVPTKGSDEAEEKANKVKELIAKEGGIISLEGKPKVMSLAYPMAQVVSNKRQVHESAYFGWVKFEILGEALEEIKNTLHADTDIIRFLIVKTKKELPQTQRRIPKKPVVRKEGGKDGEAPKEVNEAELDKELEELLTT